MQQAAGRRGASLRGVRGDFRAGRLMRCDAHSQSSTRFTAPLPVAVRPAAVSRLCVEPDRRTSALSRQETFTHRPNWSFHRSKCRADVASRLQKASFSPIAKLRGQFMTQVKKPLNPRSEAIGAELWEDHDD